MPQPLSAPQSNSLPNSSSSLRDTTPGESFANESPFARNGARHPDSLVVHRSVSARIPTRFADFQLCYYQNNRDRKEHLAFVCGEVANQHDVLVRVHSECLTGDIFGSQRCDCGPQLQAAMRQIAEAGRGVVVYLRQEGRGIGLEAKLHAYNLQDAGQDTVDANLALGHGADERHYDMAAAILRDLGVRSIGLLSNNPQKAQGLNTQGIPVVRNVPLVVGVTTKNLDYLQTKVKRMGHAIDLPELMHAVENGAAEGACAEQPRLLAPELHARVLKLRTRAAQHYAASGRPFVTLAYAQSLDGSLAAHPGQPLRLSANESMTLTHALRAAHDAILVGINTVIADDPRLNVRLIDGDDPQPVVVDTRLRTPLDARLLHGTRPPWIATTRANGAASARLAAAGATLLTLPANRNKCVNLDALLDQLAARGVRSVMVEGGPSILRSFLCDGLGDYAVITVAPRFVGGLPLLQQSQSPALYPEMYDVEQSTVGPDWVLWGTLGEQPRPATSS